MYYDDAVDENGDYVHSIPCRQGWIVEGTCDACDIRDDDHLTSDAYSFYDGIDVFGNDTFFDGSDY